MRYKTFLAGFACAIALSAPAFGQGLGLPWAPHAALGGAIGGYGIIGASRKDNAPLSALYMDRYAHVTGNYTRAIAKLDRVIRPDGSIVVMRRISPPNDPTRIDYLPNSWPGVGVIGKENILDSGGKVIATREVIIPEFQIMAAGIPNSGPPLATLAFERNILADGRAVVTARAEQPNPGVAVALMEREPWAHEFYAENGTPWPTIARR